MRYAFIRKKYSLPYTMVIGFGEYKTNVYQKHSGKARRKLSRPVFDGFSAKQKNG
jgi:hypothetical protein